jgi:site-specific DNA-methyltransferase (adenine-specific)
MTYNRDEIMRNKDVICNLHNDHMENHKRYQIKKAQLIIADIPYNLGNLAYASNTSWYVNGDNKNGESDKAGKQFFDTDKDFNIDNFFRFVKRMLKPEPKETGKAPALIILCAFNQLAPLIEIGKKWGFKTMNHPFVFTKNYSAETLKANMRPVGACEYGLLFYRDKLPKFNNNGKMVYNHMNFPKEIMGEKYHPTQKPVALIERLIEIFTDKYDVVIDPVAGSATTLVAARKLRRHSYGFEIKKDFYNKAIERLQGKEQKNIVMTYNDRGEQIAVEQVGFEL